MDNVFLILFLIFLGSTIAVFIRPKQFLKEKTESEAKKVKIGLTLVTIIFFVLFGVVSDNKKSGDASTSKVDEVSNESSQTPTPSPKAITYEIYRRWSIPNGGEGKLAIISADFFNEENMPLVCNKIRDDVTSDKNAFISVYTDKKAAEMRDTVTDVNEVSEENQEFYDKHFVAQYNKNGNSGFNECAIYYDGVLGSNNKTIKY